MASPSLTPLRLSLQPSPQTLKNPFFPSRFSTVRSPNSIKPATIKVHHRSPDSPPPWKNKSKSKTVVVNCMSVPAIDRAISAAAYFLPFFNGLQYGRFLFFKYPNLGLLFEPIFPLLNLYRSIPYSSFVAFFGLYLGVGRNPSFSKLVRFNTMQALVLDVVLVLPLLVQRFVNPSYGLGFRLLKMSYNSIFVLLLGCFVYSVGFCVVGKTPFLPFVADAADRQL